jgi:anti-sigma factor RsiW
MTCISPPELPDASLLKFLDGEADEQVERHLQKCEHCRARANALARMQGNLTRSLYRFECPSPNTLGEYHMGLLTRSDEEEVRTHLERCPHCSAEVARLEAYMSALREDLEVSQAERVKVWVARLVSGVEGALASGPRLAPVAAGVRGDEDEPLIFTAEGAQIALDIHADEQKSGKSVLMGLVTGLDVEGWQVQIWQDAELVAKARIDPSGNFLFQDLSSGEYDLILSDAETEIHIPTVKVEG